MAWDPSVLRKYSTTSHFRLLNQVRSELKATPLARNSEGELSLGLGRRGGGYRVPVDVRGSGLAAASPKPTRSVEPAPEAPGDSTSFRDRLRAIDMR